jgi:hypothetical protein
MNDKYALLKDVEFLSIIDCDAYTIIKQIPSMYMYTSMAHSLIVNEKAK